MNSWIMRKLANFLIDHEGMTVVSNKERSESTMITVQDCFGYRYQVEVTAVGRITDNTEGMESYNDPAKKSNLLSIFENIQAESEEV